MSTALAIINNLYVEIAAAFVAGHYLGDKVWQPVKHALTAAYQWAKHKIAG